MMQQKQGLQAEAQQAAAVCVWSAAEQLHLLQRA